MAPVLLVLLLLQVLHGAVGPHEALVDEGRRLQDERGQLLRVVLGVLGSAKDVKPSGTEQDVLLQFVSGFDRPDGSGLVDSGRVPCGHGEERGVDECLVSVDADAGPT